MTLNINCRFVDDEGGFWLLAVKGDVDIANASSFRKALADAYVERPADIIIDASELMYIDSTGLGVIIGAFGRMRENDHKILIEKPRANVMKLLNITCLDKIFCSI